MGYFLGIDLGASRTVAAVAWAGNGGAETVDLGDREDAGEGVASVLHLGTDGTLAVGAAARGWALTEPDRVVEGFPGRIGDDDPMLLAGEPWAPEELTAWLVRWVVDRVAEHEGTAADAVAVARPASWDDARIALLAAAVAEQELDVRFLAPEPGEPAEGDASADGGGNDGGSDAADDGAAAQVRAASAVAVELRDAARAEATLREAAGGEQPAATTASGRHAVVGGAIAALAGVPTGAGDPDRDGLDDESADDGSADDESPDREDPHGDDPHPEAPDGAGPEPRDAGTGPDASEAPGDGPADGGGSTAAPPGSWDVPAPRSHASGAYDPTGSAAGEPDPVDPDADGPHGAGRGGSSADPATTNLVAELLGFTGGMGATNTAGLLSGYTPPHGMPAAWSGGDVAVASAEAVTEIAPGTATGRAVAMPSQRASSGRWSAVAPEQAALATAAPALRARNNPTVLVGAGGLAAAVAVVGTLFLWPAPRITNSATSRPIPAVPVATAAVEPTAAPTVALTPEPTPTRRPRPAAPRTRRTVVPPVTVSESATDTAPPTGSAEPTEPTTSVSPSTEPTAPTTTKSDDD